MSWRAAVLAALGLLTAAMAAENILNLNPKPEKYKNVEGCYLTETDSVIQKGESLALPPSIGCLFYSCGEYLTQHSCDKLETLFNADVKIVFDDDKPYPGCCPKAVPNDEDHFAPIQFYD